VVLVMSVTFLFPSMVKDAITNQPSIDNVVHGLLYNHLRDSVYLNAITESLSLLW